MNLSETSETSPELTALRRAAYEYEVRTRSRPKSVRMSKATFRELLSSANPWCCPTTRFETGAWDSWEVLGMRVEFDNEMGEHAFTLLPAIVHH